MRRSTSIPWPLKSLDQDALGLRLGEDQQVRIVGLEGFEVESDVGDPLPSENAPTPWIFRARASTLSTTPMSSKTSRVLAWMPRARDCPVGPGPSSTIRQRRPCLASSQAIVRPTGPAPTTRISDDSVGFAAISGLEAGSVGVSDTIFRGERSFDQTSSLNPLGRGGKTVAWRLGSSCSGTPPDLSPRRPDLRARHRTLRGGSAGRGTPGWSGRWSGDARSGG